MRAYALAALFFAAEALRLQSLTAPDATHATTAAGHGEADAVAEQLLDDVKAEETEVAKEDEQWK